MTTLEQDRTDTVQHWTTTTLPKTLLAVAREFPDKDFIRIEGESITYAQLEREVRRVAGGLAALGVKRGDHVAISMGNSIEWAVAWFAIAWLGATLVPVNTRWKEDELAWALNFTETRVIVTTRSILNVDLLALLERVRPDTPHIEHVIVVGDDRPDYALAYAELSGPTPEPAAQPGDTALLQFTSGSTARPKGAMLSHANVLLGAYGFGAALGVRATDKFFSPRIFFHIAGSVNSILLALTAKATLVAATTFDPMKALETIQTEQCNVVAGNDTIFLMMLDQPVTPKLTSVRGGYAAAGKEVHLLINEKLGVPHLCSSYGLSEATAMAAARWDDPLDDRVNGRLRPTLGVEVMVADPATDQPVAVGESGEIYVRGATVMKGYYRQPDETAKTITPDGWLKTGDLGVAETEGRFKFVGRLKDTIRVGGENVSPAEVENMLLGHPSVVGVQVVGMPEKRLGEVVVAYVILRQGDRLEPQALVDWAKSKISGFKAPRHVKFVENFDNVLTGSGKPRKALLREMAIQDFG